MSEVSPNAADYDEKVAEPRWDSDHLIGARELTRLDPERQVVEPTRQKSGDEKVGVVPQPRCGDADEVAPPIAAQS